MRLDEVQHLTRRLLRRRTKFHYFKDRYALMLLSYVVGDGRSLRDLKSGRFAPLLRKPLVQALTARLATGRLTRADLNLVWPERSDVYLLTLGQWGGDEHWHWEQVSRPGVNLVLHLNFSGLHNAAYARLRGRSHQHPFQWSSHPCAGGRSLTCAWARMDFDLDTGEALIEEIQSDWIREALGEAKRVCRLGAEVAGHRVRQLLGNDRATLEQFVAYVERFVRPHARHWDEATLAAAIWLLRERIGIRRIYYHTLQGGNRVKHIECGQPPRSLYTTLPRRFCFTLTDDAPRMLARCRHRTVRAVLRQDRPMWYLLEL